MPPVAVEMRRQGAPVQESWGMHTHVTQTSVGETESRRRMDITADYAAWYETEQESYQLLRGVSVPIVVRLYDVEGNPSATLRATEMRYFDDDRLEAYGEVLVDAEDGTRLITDMLMWREADQSIRTDRFVRIVTTNEDVRGYGLVADEALETYQLGRFTARVIVDE